MVTTNQKFKTKRQKLKRKWQKHTLKKTIKSQGSKQKEIKRKLQKQSNIISTYLSIVKGQSICCLQETHITAKNRERKRMEKRVCANGNEKKERITMLILWNIDFKIKCIAKNQRRVLHNDKGVNTRREHYTQQHVCTQYRYISIYKASINRHKGRNWQ